MTYVEPVNWEEAGEVIRARMEAQPRGYSAQLARTLGKTPGYVYQIMKGRRPLPQEHLPAILESIGMSYEVVLRDRGEQ